MMTCLKAASARSSVGDGREDGDDAVGVGAGVDADGEGGDGEVAGEVGDGGDLAVGHDVEGAVAVAERGEAEGEVFDGAVQAGDFDDVADVVLVFDEDEDAVEHVFEDGLRAEADAEADDAGGGDEGAERDADRSRAVCMNDDRSREAVGGGADDGGDGAELGGALGVADQRSARCCNRVDEKAGDVLEDESDQESDDDLGQAVLQEVDEVVVPVAFEPEE